MGILLCEQNFRDVWIRNESVQAEIFQILHTDVYTSTHTTAGKLVVRVALRPTSTSADIDVIQWDSGGLVTLDHFCTLGRWIYRFLRTLIN